MKLKWMAIAVLFAIGASGALVAQDGKDDVVDLPIPPTLEQHLEGLYEGHVEALNKEDVEGSMKLVHPKSDIYEGTKQASEQLFEVYDIKVGIISIRLIGQDDDYCILRVKQRTTKVAGPEFRDNDLDALQVFKRHEGAWKIWTTTVLSIDFIEEEK